MVVELFPTAATANINSKRCGNISECLEHNLHAQFRNEVANNWAIFWKIIWIQAIQQETNQNLFISFVSTWKSGYAKRQPGQLWVSDHVILHIEIVQWRYVQDIWLWFMFIIFGRHGQYDSCANIRWFYYTLILQEKHQILSSNEWNVIKPYMQCRSEGMAVIKSSNMSELDNII